MAWEKENRALNPLRAFSHLPCYFLRCICLPQLNGGNVPLSLLSRVLFASPAPLALSWYANSWGRMHFARCQRFFLLLPPILLLLPLLQEHSVFPFLFFFCLRTLPSFLFRFLFLFFLLVRILISQTSRRISFSTCCVLTRLITLFRSVCLFQFWSTPLKTVQITPERLFVSWVKISRELKAV